MLQTYKHTTVVGKEGRLFSKQRRSRHLTATFILLLGLLVEVDGHGTQVLAPRHECVQVLASLEDVVQVLMHDLLNFE